MRNRKALEFATSPAEARTSWVLRTAKGAASFDKPEGFAEALKKAMTDAANIELLFAIWEQNVGTVRALNKCLARQGSKPRLAQTLVVHLKQCAITLAKTSGGNKSLPSQPVPSRVNGQQRSKIDKSVLALSEPKRFRSKEHLRFVARQPCLICGRSPSQAHHIRYAQSRGLGLKVSDEFTVPLCAIHHTENHATGDERQWWQEHKIDPLLIAEELWQKNRAVTAADEALHNLRG